MFPAGPAGLALLVLRLSVVGTLLMNFSEFGGSGSSAFRNLAIAILTTVLCVGLVTPVACIGAIFLQIASFKSSNLHAEVDVVFHIMTTLSLLFLGPGAYSMDARLFGRRLILRPPE
jgi:hypothetical protein